MDSHDKALAPKAMQQAESKLSLLELMADGLTGMVVCDKTAREEFNRYSCGAFKTLGLFAHGRFGLATSVVSHAA